MVSLQRFGWYCLFGLFAFLIAACGPPKAEDMEKAWHTNEENAQKFAAKYPGFKTAIDDLLKNAKAEFDEAKKGDEKTKGEKMKVPVDKVASSIKIFETYESELAKLEGLLKDKDINDMPRSKTESAFKNADAGKTKADDMLKKGNFANMGEGKAKLEDAIKMIQDASKELEALKPAKAGGGGTSSPNTNSTSSPGAGTSKP